MALDRRLRRGDRIMALIDIDDRDTIHNYYTQAAEQAEVVRSKFKEYLGILKGENPSVVINHIGNGIYKLDLAVITCTGADVENIFNIPFMHELRKFEIKHVDASKADSTNALAYSVSHRHHPNLWMLLLSVPVSTASDIIDEYSDYDMQSGEYKLITNSTNTELLYISVYIKITGE